MPEENDTPIDPDVLSVTVRTILEKILNESGGINEYAEENNIEPPFSCGWL